jgi:hypothetical protein
LVVHANEQTVSIDFPTDFSGKTVKGNVHFYSAVNKEWDKTFDLSVSGNTMSVDRSVLRNTNYIMKLSYSVDGKSYYQESGINLSK